MWRWIQQFDRLLRGDLTAMPVLRVDGLDVPILGLAVIIDLLGMSYGACMGLFAVAGSGNGSKMQIAASMLKVPALYLLTLLVTLPSLYVFNALLGSRLTLSSTTRLLVCALAVMLITFIFVGIQMGWVLRPFVGSPLTATRFFRADAWSNAYEMVGKMAWDVLRRAG